MMKLLLLVLGMSLLVSGCGTLRIDPRGCKTEAVWGTSPTATREVTKEELYEELVMDLKAKESFFVVFDRDLKLRELLEEHAMRCEEVKKLRVVIKTTWFFMREVALKVIKL